MVARLLAIVFAASFAASFVASANAEPSAGKLCSSKKLRATAKAFQCLVLGKNRDLEGQPFDPATCEDRHARLFSSAELTGGCPVVGDSAMAFAHASVRASALFDLTAMETIDCALTIHRYSSKFISCIAPLVTKRVRSSLNGVDSSDFSDCLSRWVAGDFGCVNFGYDVAGVIAAASGYLRGADLTGNSFAAGVFLPGAELREANFSSSSVSSSVLSGADFRGANLQGATLGHSDLENADFEGADFTNLSSAQLITCPANLPPDWVCVPVGFWFEAFELFGPTVVHSYRTLFDLELPNINLAGARFLDVELGGCNFQGGSLAGATLEWVSLVGCELTGVDLTGADLMGIDWASTTCPDGTNADSNGGTCCGHHVGGAPSSCSP